jgi:3-oxoadipate enol-lactonase
LKNHEGDLRIMTRDLLADTGRTVRRKIREVAHIPAVEIPEGRWFDIPRRGRTWLTDIPGPTPDAPTIILLHAVGCTGMLTWFTSIDELKKRYRVIIFDQRWHGRGIISEHFSIHDCADDVAAVIQELELEKPIIAGYSMGSIIAQRVWRQHPDMVGGLVLGATTGHFRNNIQERFFHAGLEIGGGAMRALSKAKVLDRAGRTAAKVLRIGQDEGDIAEWAIDEWRSTSPWAIGQAVASLGRHHSTPWLNRVDVPVAVVVTMKDKVIPTERQLALAGAIPGATIHEANTGHAGVVMESEGFVPAFIEAVNVTQARISDKGRRTAKKNAASTAKKRAVRPA